MSVGNDQFLEAQKASFSFVASHAPPRSMNFCIQLAAGLRNRSGKGLFILLLTATPFWVTFIPCSLARESGQESVKSSNCLSD